MANLTDIRSSWSAGASEGGVTVYATKENLPTTGLTSGDQAYVSNTSRLYISNGSGWYNVALINATPSLTIDPTGAIELSTEGATTTITLTATDSDNAVAGLTFSVDSDGSFAGLGTISQDSSVFTITPLSEDSATTTESTLTFKASDGISFGSGSRTLSLTFRVANSNYTTLLAKADTAGTDNQVDASTISRTITEGGNTTSTAFSPYHPGGYSVYLDGTSNSNIQIKGESAVTVGTSDFSLSFWYKGDLASNRVIASSVATNSATQLYWNVSVRSDGAVWLQTRSTANSGLQKWGKSAAGRVTANTWHHITVSRQSGWHYVAIDGVQDTSVDRDQATFNITSQELTVGLSNITGYASYGKGYITDYNFCVGASEYDLSVGDGNVAYTVPDEPITPHANTKFLLSGLPYIVDASASPLTIDIIGSAVSKLRDGPYDYLGYSKAEYGGSIYSDGTGDYMTTPADTTHLTMAGDFTIDFWYYPTAAKSNGYVYGKYNNNSDAWAIFITPNWSSGNFGYLTFYYGNYGSNESATSLRSNLITLNVWHYCRITRASGVFYMSVNGEVGARSNYGANGLSWSDTRTFNADTTIGITGQTAYTLGQAYLADFRVINGTALTTSDFTPPTAPVSAVTNTKLLTCTNKNDIWDASSGKLLTKAGNTTASNTQRKFATSSAMYFDGTDDYITVADSTDFDFGTGDFTMEGWYYATDVSGDRYILNFTTSAGNGHFGVNFYNGGWRVGLFNGSLITGTTGIETNVWHHFAWVRQSGTMKFYIDGTQVGSDVTYSSALDCSGTFRIGTYATTPTYGEFLGYVQDVRITKGLARYTSSFTPPTSEFSG